jgi:hypothetical protein
MQIVESFSPHNPARTPLTTKQIGAVIRIAHRPPGGGPRRAAAIIEEPLMAASAALLHQRQEPLNRSACSPRGDRDQAGRAKTRVSWSSISRKRRSH